MGRTEERRWLQARGPHRFDRWPGMAQVPKVRPRETARETVSGIGGSGRCIRRVRRKADIGGLECRLMRSQATARKPTTDVVTPERGTRRFDAHWPEK